MKFIKDYPRISLLGIGFIVGFISMGITVVRDGATIKDYRSKISRLEEQHQTLAMSSKTQIESLSKMNESLKQRIKKTKVVLPDGTIREEMTTDNDRNTTTETQVRATVTAEYEKKITKIKSEHVQTVNKLSQRKLTLGLGLTSQGAYYVHGSYPIYGPIGIGGGANAKGTFMIDLGVSF